MDERLKFLYKKLERLQKIEEKKYEEGNNYEELLHLGRQIDALTREISALERRS